MNFGNWIISDEGIAWNSNGFNHFKIPKEELNNLRQTASGPLYDWVLLATEEDWLTQDDLYDFNYAFVFAMARFALPFDYDIFDATLAEQYDRLDEEDEDFDF